MHRLAVESRASRGGQGVSRHRRRQELLQSLHCAAVQLAQVEVERLVRDLVASGGRDHLHDVLQLLIVLQGHDLVVQLLKLAQILRGQLELSWCRHLTGRMAAVAVRVIVVIIIIII